MLVVIYVYIYVFLNTHICWLNPQGPRPPRHQLVRLEMCTTLLHLDGTFCAVGDLEASKYPTIDMVCLKMGYATQ